jgi:S1-C subfamily serine protease
LPTYFRDRTLGDSDTVVVGEDVIAMGFPSGDIEVLHDSPTITKGIVSAKRVSGSGVRLLQTDAAINPGTSDGPLFDRDGRVVGVNTLKIFESGDGRPVEGIGLVVAISEVKDRMGSLEKDSLADSFISVSAGQFNTCGLKTDRSVVCWGNDFERQSSGDSMLTLLTSMITGEYSDRRTQATTAGSFASVSAGSWYTCAVKTDGAVICWGYNSAGQATHHPLCV